MTFSKISEYFLLFFFVIGSLNHLNRNNLHAKEDLRAIFQKAESLFKKKKFSEALSLYESVISKDPSFIKGYRGIIKCYTALGDPQGAAIFIESIFLENPENAEVCYGLGYSLYNLKKYNDAKVYFEKAIKLNPDLAEAWNNCAAIYHFVLHDYERARSYYEKAISISRRTENNWVLEIAKKNLAHLPPKEVLQPIKDKLTIEEFINRFISSVEKNDKKEIKQLVLGQKENSKQAMDWLLKEAMRAFSEDKKEDEKTAILLAKLLDKEYRNSFKSNLLKSKLDTYRNLSDEKKKLLIKGETCVNEGLIKEKNKRYSEALNSYKKALSSFKDINDKSKIGLTYVYIGDVYLKMKEYALAREVYQSGLSLFIETKEEKRKALVLSSIGRACFLSGDYKEALDFLEQSLEAYRLLKDYDSEKKVKQNIELVMTKINPE